LRQQSGGAYEAVDGSYLQLTENGASSLSLRTTDGTLMSYAKINNEWRCAEVKDRNGNYLTAAYKWWGGLDQVTDTLGRLLTFHYDNKKKLTSIRQSWNGGAATQYWARFEYDAFEINPVFSGPQITGTRGGQVWPVLAAVVMPDNSRYQFSYNNNGQVNKIENLAADSHKLNHLFYLLDNGPLADRVTQAKVWAEDWQNETEVTAASYAAPVSASWTLPYNGANQTGLKSVVTTNDGVESRLYFGDAGWQRGLGLFAETYANNVAQRWTATEWDDEADNTLRGCYRIALDAYDKTQSTLVGQGLNLAFSVGVFGAVKDVADAAEGFRDGFRAVYSLRAGARIPINGGAQYAKVTVGGGFKRAFFGGLKGAGRGAGGLLSLGLMGAGTILSGGDHFFGSGAWLRGAIRSCNQGNPNASKFVEPGLGIGLAGRVRSFLP
jgi:hypothetical protein